MIPVDEPRGYPTRAGDDERVRGPEVAVQERLRPAELRHRLRSLWLLVKEGIHSLERAGPHCQLLRGQFDLGLPQRFQAPDGVAHVGRVKIDPSVVAIEATLYEQSVFGEAGV